MKGTRVPSTGVVPLLGHVRNAVSEAMARVRPEFAGADPVVRRSERADFQSNAALALAKKSRTAPAELAAAIAAELGRADGAALAAVERSGPGF
ncbi:MAG: arginine--tRNA ligase, partial [Nocardia sp.]|nr:arginine--tRNA ligase [Nocardia sp.]